MTQSSMTYTAPGQGLASVVLAVRERVANLRERTRLAGGDVSQRHNTQGQTVPIGTPKGVPSYTRIAHHFPDLKKMISAHAEQLTETAECAALMVATILTLYLTAILGQ